MVKLEHILLIITIDMTQQSEIAWEILSNLFMGKMEWRENF
jgi:hypothetical protein